MTGVFEHWPNRITALRFVGSLVLFVVLAVWGEGTPEPAPGEVASWAMVVAFWLFVTMAATDFVDGYLARRDNVVTAFGRIADPFVDKVLVLGTMIFLAVQDWSKPWVPAWVVVVVLAREFLVTGIRGWVESLGREFPADRWGKIKMVVQCVAIGCVIGYFAFPWTAELRRLVGILGHVCVWATLIASIGSGFSYVWKSRGLLTEDQS
jgi:CDP-diacylglycerol--glycerol-3-phosphate 3-phosphatidyltransferase